MDYGNYLYFIEIVYFQHFSTKLIYSLECWKCRLIPRKQKKKSTWKPKSRNEEREIELFFEYLRNVLATCGRI